INAGRYLDGEPMEALAQEAFALTLATASGQRTKGEAAGHSQVSLWRNWPQADGADLAALQARSAPNGIPLRHAQRRTNNEEPGTPPLRVFRTDAGFATERVGLVLPTSLCSSQISRLAA